MNIKLLSCRSPFLDDDRIYPPLANLYLYNAIKRDHPEWNVQVGDNYSLTDSSWLNGVDILGVSIMTPQREEANKILNFVKANSNIKVVAGGPHAKFYLSEMKEEKWDKIVTHDGERCISDVLSLNVPRVFTDVLSVGDFPHYAVKPARLENKDFLADFKYSIEGKKSTTLMTARGCPMACRFCEDANTKVKRQPIRLLEEEVEDIKKLGYEGVYIFDDLFAMKTEMMYAPTRLFKEHNLIYRCNGHAGRLDERMADLLADTGCKEIAFGAESGAQPILDNINKGTTVQQNYDFVRIAKSRGIKVKAFLMLGLPGETRETIKETERFISTSGIDTFGLYAYYPYKGTKFRELMDMKAPIDLYFLGEGLGAYGTKGGNSECRVRTTGLSYTEIAEERDRLIKLYGSKK